MTDACTRCDQERPKHARWYWVDSNARPPIVYCQPCAAIVAPERVAARAKSAAEIRARAAATRARGAGR